MPAEVILTCCGNSHPFLERRIILSEAVKIGRSVAQARPSDTNGIFDCKVLSRNHALIWHDNGKFYLQDTKSSNGTFVNNQRLSKGNEESVPRQLSPLDILQFGVDVVENSRQVTHSCIMATIRLFDKTGNEIKNPAFDATSTSSSSFHSQEFYQLVHYLQEALNREQALEEKLLSLQQLVISTEQSSADCWKNQVNEDKLLSRLDILEHQLCVFNKLQPVEGVKKELLDMQQDKILYEIEAKKSVKKLVEEKLQVTLKQSEIETSLKSTESELACLKESKESLLKELEDLLEKNKSLNEEHEKLKEDFNTLKSQSEKDVNELEEKVQQLTTDNSQLTNKLESLQVDRDFNAEQLNNIKDKMLLMKTEGKAGVKIDAIDKGVQAEIINLFDIKSLMNMQNNEDEDENGEKYVKDTVDDIKNSEAGKDEEDEDDEDEDEEKDDEKSENETCEKPNVIMNAGDTLLSNKITPLKSNHIIKDNLGGKEKLDCSKSGKENRKGGEEEVSKDDENKASQKEKQYKLLEELAYSLGGNEEAVIKHLQASTKGVVTSTICDKSCDDDDKNDVDGISVNITDSQKELYEKDMEIGRLEEAFKESKDEVEKMHAEVDDVMSSYRTLSTHAQSLSIISLVPIIVFLISLLMAFYPIFSSSTATSQASIDL